MKNLFSLSLLAFIIIFTSCDSDDEFTKISIDTQIQQNFDVNVTENGPTTLTINKSFDTTIDADVAAFGDRIESYDLDSISLEFTSYVGAENIDLTNATISLSTADGTTLGSLTLVPTSSTQSINIKEFDDSNTLIIVTLDDTSEQTLTDALLADNEIVMTMILSVNGQPVEFTVEAILYLKVTGTIAS